MSSKCIDIVLFRLVDEERRKSCTILISGKPVCIHDETWKQCEVRLHVLRIKYWV